MTTCVIHVAKLLLLWAGPEALKLLESLQPVSLNTEKL